MQIHLQELELLKPKLLVEYLFLMLFHQTQKAQLVVKLAEFPEPMIFSYL